MKPTLTFTVALLMFAAPQAHAWGPLGHKVVAQVAEHRLSPKALRAVQDILGPAVGLDAVSNCADSLLYSNDPTFPCAGAFAVKSDPGKVTGPWHYLSIPSTASPTAASLMSFCPNGQDCVVAQIRRQAEALGKPGATRAEKQVALMYLVHFVGDEHQPLHCASDNDYGGNLKPVTLLGAKKNLHSLWDDLIEPEDWRQQAAMDPGPRTKALETDLARKNISPWTAGDFVTQAALESFAIARDLYAQYAVHHGQGLGAAYQAQAKPIAAERMEQAAVRLAALIEEALGSGPAGKPSAPNAVTPQAAARLDSIVKANADGPKFE